jgi:hypothetical protein
MVAALFICVWIKPEVMMDLRKTTQIFRAKIECCRPNFLDLICCFVFNYTDSVLLLLD